MEVAIPPAATMDFNFDSACSSPYISAPSSPKRFGEFYFSAPTSPTRASAIYREFNDLSTIKSSGGTGGSSAVVPFDWEEQPGKPKSNDDDDFAFDFSERFETASLSAAELFDGGVIRPLKPPPRLQLGGNESTTWKSPVSSPRSPISQGKKMFREAFSPRHKKEIDPFAAAIDHTRKESEQGRGRERIPVSSSSNSGRRGTRSLSPLRVSEFAWEEQQQQQQQQEEQNTKAGSMNSKPSSSSSSLSSFMGYKKWRLKDFLLFRSASEGRASERDVLRKYTGLSKRHEEVKNSSFRSIDSSGSVSSSKRRGPVSAHELHYKVNRTVSEEMKRKTFLPYKQGLLGCLGFNPTFHGLARGFGTRG